MQYQSTRNTSVSLTSAQAIALGLSRDGGLFVPESFPSFPAGMLERMTILPYIERAVTVMKLFLEDYSESELREYAEKAYGYPNFDHRDVAPVVKTDVNTYFLELWHGPTSAFKDVALQMLPHLLSSSLQKTGETKDACILVATSGDTGKAALEGFCDVPRTKIMVFYPEDGVSDVQKLQMTTQSGSNVGVSAVAGNFDDAQTGVKKIFSDEKLRETLGAAGWFLSSANSINFGRLLPQIVYYVSAYCDLVKAGDIAMGEKINFCVPTGNFGNILAGYYAKKMGLPVGRFICASNCNDVLTEFIETGVYNKNRTFTPTISPSMDILVSSNLERLLYDLSGKDDTLIGSYMRALNAEGQYTASQEIIDGIKSCFSAGRCSDDETRKTIRQIYLREHYLIDTHTAVAYNVLQKYRKKTKDTAKTVVVSTASPFKFSDSVLDALGEKTTLSGFDLIDRLESFTGVRAPEPLRVLRGKKVRFTESVEKDGMSAIVERFLK
jgi:threonine synthase